MCVCQASITPLTGLSQVTIETDGDAAYRGGGKGGEIRGLGQSGRHCVTPEDERCSMQLQEGSVGLREQIFRFHFV